VQVERSAAELLAAGAEALVEAGFRTGDYEGIKETLEEARDRAVADGDRATEAAAIDRLGMLMHFRALDRDRESADAVAEEALFLQALAIRREIGDPAGTAESLFDVGLVHQVLRRNWDDAMPYFLEAMTLAEEHGDALLRSEVHRHIGFHYMVFDVQPAKALDHLRRSFELRDEYGDPRWIPSGTVAIGLAELVAGNREVTIGQLRLALRQMREVGIHARRIERAEELLRRAESGEPLAL
jgi:tetratricopeptide (TPR) repeat protein